MTALSRGKGVPQGAREALRTVREAAEADRARGLRVHVATARLGLEGETRLCVEYADPAAGGRAYERAQALAKGVELVNLVAGPCASPAPSPGKANEEEES
jgi:hypothetical protein